MPGNDDNILHAIYRRVHGERPGEGAREFIRHLSWIGLSFAAAKVISGLLNIFAARLLGPAEYGRINVFVSAGAFIAPFFLAGIHYSVVKYGSVKDGQKEVFGTASVVYFTLTLFMGALIFLLRRHIGAFFGIEVKTLLLALCYAMATGAFFMVSAMQQALGLFPKRGFSEIAISVIMTAGFGLGLFFLGRVYEAMAYAYIAAFGGVSLFWFVRIGRQFDLFNFSRERLRPLLEYGSYYFGSGLGSFLLLNVQSLILNTYLSPNEVGSYAAYFTASIGIAGYLGYAANTVLFPKASASTNRRRLWDIAAASWKKLFPLVTLALFAAEAAILALMGSRQYGMDPWLMFLFAAAGTLMLMHSSLGQIVYADSIRASRLALYIGLGAGVFNFLVCLFIIPAMGIKGVAVSLILTHALMLVCLRKARDPYLGEPSPGA